MQEKNAVAAEIRLRVISRAMAQRVRRGWQTRAEEIYLYLLNHLLEEPEAEDGEPGEDRTGDR